MTNFKLGCLAMLCRLRNSNKSGHKSTLAVPWKIFKHYGSPCYCYLNKSYESRRYITNLASSALNLPGATLPQLLITRFLILKVPKFLGKIQKCNDPKTFWDNKKCFFSPNICGSKSDTILTFFSPRVSAVEAARTLLQVSISSTFNVQLLRL